ncbi:MAG: isoprenyl transferase [Candidatus Omnitrophica bacterium]|nr:isoprenyl transferase [Candidatus Omnitrophota bacterium]
MDTSPNQPHHIAIIMDGNGRWATARGLPRVLGHRAGAQAVHRIVEACCEVGVGALTLYAFSWENRARPAQEIRELMGLLDEFIRRERPTLLANRIRLQAIGRLEELPPGVINNLRRVIAETAQGERLILTLALSYGGRQEIVDAARRLAERVRRGELRADQIDEALFARHLYTGDLPDPDLLIRTSGEQRLSNFLLWQSSYAELYVTPTLWPDFSKQDLLEAIAEYERRERRFGRIVPPVAASVVSPRQACAQRAVSINAALSP